MPDNHAVENKTTWRPRLGETDRMEKQSLNAVEEGNCVIGEEEQVWTPTRIPHALLLLRTCGL